MSGTGPNTGLKEAISESPLAFGTFKWNDVLNFELDNLMCESTLKIVGQNNETFTFFFSASIVL